MNKEEIIWAVQLYLTGITWMRDMISNEMDLNFWTCRTEARQVGVSCSTVYSMGNRMSVGVSGMCIALQARGCWARAITPVSICYYGNHAGCAATSCQSPGFWPAKNLNFCQILTSFEVIICTNHEWLRLYMWPPLITRISADVWYETCWEWYGWTLFILRNVNITGGALCTKEGGHILHVGCTCLLLYPGPGL